MDNEDIEDGADNGDEEVEEDGEINGGYEIDDEDKEEVEDGG